MPRASLLSSVVLLLAACLPVSAQDDITAPDFGSFSFDVAEFEKSPWSVGGYLQADLGFARLDRDAAFYRLGFLGKEQDAERVQGGIELQAGLGFQQGSLAASALGLVKQSHDGEEWDNDALLYGGSLSWKASSSVYFLLGKTLLQWGKGYAWNPTNFVGRIKNPSDPELSLEGYWLGLADIVKSFSGSLKTVALTAVILPVADDVNSDFGEERRVNVAGKLYVLLHDTDIDLMALLEGSRTLRYGLTASRNLSVNFEAHAEVAHVSSFQKAVVDPGGIVTLHKKDTRSALAGIRYLASTNTTLIFEYYHNGEGYSGNEAKDMFGFVTATDDSTLAAVRPSLSGYLLPHFGRDYLYLKVSQKEPFGWLSVTPALLTFLNLSDGSSNIIPEIVYSGIENLELRSRLSFLPGAERSEFGERVNDWKMEFRARYYF